MLRRGGSARTQAAPGQADNTTIESKSSNANHYAEQSDHGPIPTLGLGFGQHHFSHGLTTASEGNCVAQAYLVSCDCAGGGFVGVGGFTTGVSVS